jgi:hypothetical protein
VGVWTYIEVSDEFNGVAEAKRVLLELSIADGALSGGTERSYRISKVSRRSTYG